MSAGARILRKGGLLILACECREGIPANSPLDKLQHSASSAEEILAMLSTPGFARPEQWQAQIQALIQRQAEVLLYSRLPEAVVRGAFLKSCPDIAAAVRERIQTLGPEARVPFPLPRKAARRNRRSLCAGQFSRPAPFLRAHRHCPTLLPPR